MATNAAGDEAIDPLRALEAIETTIRVNCQPWRREIEIHER